jgi:hypothetical protein
MEEKGKKQKEEQEKELGKEDVRIEGTFRTRENNRNTRQEKGWMRS